MHDRTIGDDAGRAERRTAGSGDKASLDHAQILKLVDHAAAIASIVCASPTEPGCACLGGKPLLRPTFFWLIRAFGEADLGQGFTT